MLKRRLASFESPDDETYTYNAGAGSVSLSTLSRAPGGGGHSVHFIQPFSASVVAGPTIGVSRTSIVACDDIDGFNFGLFATEPLTIVALPTTSMTIRLRDQNLHSASATFTLDTVRSGIWESVFVPFSAFTNADEATPLARQAIKDVRIGLPSSTFPYLLNFYIDSLSAIRLTDSRS